MPEMVLGPLTEGWNDAGEGWCGTCEHPHCTQEALLFSNQVKEPNVWLFIDRWTNRRCFSKPLMIGPDHPIRLADRYYSNPCTLSVTMAVGVDPSS